MALRALESFMFDSSGGTIAKALKRGYSYLSKADAALGTDDVSGLSNGHVSFTSPGRYSDGTKLSLNAADEYFPQGCPSCVSDWGNFGTYFKIPIPNTTLDTYGVIGFSLYFNYLPNASVSNGMQDDTDNDGHVFFALGDLATNQVQVVAGVRASDDRMYIKVKTTAVDLAVSTGVTGTNSAGYRAYHNDNGTCTISSFTPVTGTWYTVEIKYKISTGGAGHVLLYVNGQKVAETATNLTFSTTHRNAAFLAAMYSLVTANPAAPNNISDPSYYFDDFYMLDATGSKNTDYLGNYRVRHTYPTADYIHEGYTAGTPYSDMASDDDESSYITIASGEREVFEVNDLSDLSTRIRGVKYNFVTYFENNNNIRILPLSEYGGVLHSGYVNQIPVSGGGWIYHGIPIESSLITGRDWTRQEINDGYHGYTILS